MLSESGSNPGSAGRTLYPLRQGNHRTQGLPVGHYVHYAKAIIEPRVCRSDTISTTPRQSSNPGSAGRTLCPLRQGNHRTQGLPVGHFVHYAKAIIEPRVCRSDTISTTPRQSSNPGSAGRTLYPLRQGNHRTQGLPVGHYVHYAKALIEPRVCRSDNYVHYAKAIIEPRVCRSDTYPLRQGNHRTQGLPVGHYVHYAKAIIEPRVCRSDTISTTSRQSSNPRSAGRTLCPLRQGQSSNPGSAGRTLCPLRQCNHRTQGLPVGYYIHYAKAIIETQGLPVDTMFTTPRESSNPGSAGRTLSTTPRQSSNPGSAGRTLFPLRQGNHRTQGLPSGHYIHYAKAIIEPRVFRSDTTSYYAKAIIEPRVCRSDTISTTPRQLSTQDLPVGHYVHYAKAIIEPRVLPSDTISTTPRQIIEPRGLPVGHYIHYAKAIIEPRVCRSDTISTTPRQSSNHVHGFMLGITRVNL
ncbi:hypothetical protein DPMN_031146 [Dreissena polymorpha]|uniref:Uncharacterized protein n=1 Tax=Dreissena polymorpha TaxID=45954 RepID=A0A9D4LZF3_DREPO|nr:hypothetical protein DPMN_031146 [Dreissena polymorpha]